MKRPWIPLLLGASLVLAAGCRYPNTLPAAPTGGPEGGGKIASMGGAAHAASSQTHAAAAPAAAPATGTAPAAGGGGAPTKFEDTASGQPGYDVVLALTAPSADASAGKAVFEAKCSTCHGNTGVGDGPGAVGLDPAPRNLTQPGSYKFGADLKGIFRTGKYGIADSPMVPWEGLLTDEEIWSAAAYIETLQKK